MKLHVHKSPPLDPILIQFSPAPILSTNLFESHFNIIPYLRLDLTSRPFPSKYVHICLSSLEAVWTDQCIIEFFVPAMKKLPFYEPNSDIINRNTLTNLYNFLRRYDLCIPFLHMIEIWWYYRLMWGKNSEKFVFVRLVPLKVRSYEACSLFLTLGGLYESGVVLYNCS